MRSFHLLGLLGASVTIAVTLGAASLPSAMIGPGEWEVSATAAARGEKLCLSDPALLIQWEQRTKACERTVLTSSADRAEVHYTCSGGGFGTSKVEELTPRSVKVDSQGIADGLPFARTIYAHRLGACRAR